MKKFWNSLFCLQKNAPVCNSVKFITNIVFIFDWCQKVFVWLKRTTQDAQLRNFFPDPHSLVLDGISGIFFLKVNSDQVGSIALVFSNLCSGNPSRGDFLCSKTKNRFQEISNGLKGTLYQFQDRFLTNDTTANPFRVVPNKVSFRGLTFCASPEFSTSMILDFDLENKIIRSYNEVQQYLAGDVGLLLQSGNFLMM